MDATRIPPVMILGCGRSGTSIFGELFEHLPAYQYFSEPPFADVMNADHLTPLAFKVPREDPAYKAEPGLSFPLSVMQKRTPGMTYFWVVRHPLDTICSLRVGIAQNWGHHPRPPDWQEWSSRPLLQQCAHHWAFLNTVGYNQVLNVATVVRFEEMVLNPTAVTKAVCGTLGIDHLTYQRSLSNWIRRVQNTNNNDFVEAKTSREYSRPDHSVRVGRWRENLSLDDVKSILPIVSEAARNVGYDLGEF